MASGGSDIHDPLGLQPPGPARRWPSVRTAGVAVVVVLSVLAYAVAYHMFSEPHRDAALATIATISPPAFSPASSETGSVSDTAAAPVVADRNTEAGVSVIRPGGASAPTPLIINVPRVLGLQLAPAPDARLVEKSRYGPLPRVGPDGAKPLDVYARPLLTSLPADAPRIVLVVGGMGLSETLSRQAAEALPGAVTLAFAPYGDRLEASVADARAHGHEVLLQAPMETFDASTQPHMLRTEGTPESTLDDLHWLMSRFTGYVGVGTFLGGRFTSDEAAFRPVLRDVAARGLLLFDDGGSARSLATTLGPQVGAPVVRADVTLDGDGIEVGLVKLEAVARTKGTAVGVATGLPRTIERLARFAQGLDARGLSLVPLTSAVDKNQPANPSPVTRMP